MSCIGMTTLRNYLIIGCEIREFLQNEHETRA